MKSFSLTRTNPALTTNVSIINTSDDKLYFESINSDGILNSDKYKFHIINQDSNFGNEIFKYWEGTEKEVAFKTKYSNDVDKMFTDYRYQYDDIYFSGCSLVQDTRYQEEFECLAPIYLYPYNIPDSFLIFRIDDSGLVNLTKDNFREDFLNKMKIVTRFDLTDKSNIGKFIHNSINVEGFPIHPIELNFNDSEFSYWNGIEFNSGNFISKSLILKDEINREMTYDQSNSLITNNFKNFGIIYPNIFNFKFLFNDTPATPTQLRTWSLNRYSGFYGDLDSIKKVSLYKPPKLKEELKLDPQNRFLLNGEFVDPFERGYKNNRTYYVEYNSKFYLVKKINIDTFKIISDVVLPETVDGNFNQNIITIGENNEISYVDNSTTFENDINEAADIICMEIDGALHRIKLNSSGKYFIFSDYAFTIVNNIFKYYINQSDSSYTTTLDLNDIDENNPPELINIYKFNFSDIKDFDFRIIDTPIGNYEYELVDNITQNQQPKIFDSDLNYKDNSRPIQSYIFKNEYVNIPVSSEYVSTSELFQTKYTGFPLIEMWKKNSWNCKWAIIDSNNHYDYPYLFNNNSVSDNYNQAPDVNASKPNYINRNMDYMYTFGTTESNYGYSENIDNLSLHVTSTNNFDLGKYFNIDYDGDYFTEIFYYSEILNNKERERIKYSNFIVGDSNIPNETFFKGINYRIHSVDSVLTSIVDGKKSIESFNTKLENEFENYKFSAILSQESHNIDSDFDPINVVSDWKLIKKWSKNGTYEVGDVVLYDGSRYKDSNGQYGIGGIVVPPSSNIGSTAYGAVEANPYVYPDGTLQSVPIAATGPNYGAEELFICNTNHSASGDTSNILDYSYWSNYPVAYSNRTIFYNRSKDYFTINNLGSILPLTTLQNNDLTKYIVYYRGEYYKCISDIAVSDIISPDYIEYDNDGNVIKYWEKVIHYSKNVTYESNDIFVYKEDLYYYDHSTKNLTILYSNRVNTNKEYNQFEVVKYNNKLWVANSTGNNKATWDNGVSIYINKKWKNILLHVYSNDSTIKNMYNESRELLYNERNTHLTAANVIECINNLNNKYGFVNYLKYYVIEEDGTYTKYDFNNIENLPYLVECIKPTEINVFKNSLLISGDDIPDSIFRIKKRLLNNEISSIEELNYYNDNPLASIVERNYDFDNYYSPTFDIYRQDGYYQPIFYNIPLFVPNYLGNYFFNTNYYDFGEIKEIIKTKVGDKNYLKIDSDSYESIYPQIDEFGYFVDSHFIFKSSWDKNYYKKVSK